MIDAWGDRGLLRELPGVPAGIVTDMKVCRINKFNLH